MFGERLDLAGTEHVARQAARLVRPGDTILLRGPLGAGKTAFARAFIRTLADDKNLDVPSPSFTLVQTYDTAAGLVHHLDLWRIAGPSDLNELGWDDLLRDVVLVEWPERLVSRRPDDALEVAFHVNQDGTRTLRITGWNDRWPR
jgi:tRNA threonylcarbamoyladenosine biosynthesis protein TsaE